MPKPREDLFMPLPPGEVFLPDPDKLIYHAREILPNACLLDAYGPRVQPAIQPPPVDVSPPYEKIERFWTAHTILPFHICMDSCYTEFMDFMQYTSDDIAKIKIATKGQAIKTNWKLARKGIITSSNFKKVCHSTDLNRTASALILGSSLDESNLPEPIMYGRKFEKRALEIFIRSHRYRHRKCQLSDVGLIISTKYPMLGTSPDGIVNCSICGTFLVEVKCLFTYRNFFHKNALVTSKICSLGENGELQIEKKHQYNYQIQGQLEITGINRCVLIGYTRQGVCPVTLMWTCGMKCIQNSLHFTRKVSL